MLPPILHSLPTKRQRAVVVAGITAIAALLLFATVTFRSPRMPTSPSDRIEDVSRTELHIVEVLRNVDTLGGTISIYFTVSYAGATHRVPSKGFIRLRSAEKARIDYVFRPHRTNPPRWARIEVFDDSGARIGAVDVNLAEWPFAYAPQSKCEEYLYVLDSTYPFEQFRGYVAPNTVRFRCFGAGDHFLEFRLRGVMKPAE
jgi:hypothetical protein